VAAAVVAAVVEENVAPVANREDAGTNAVNAPRVASVARNGANDLRKGVARNGHRSVQKVSAPKEVLDRGAGGDLKRAATNPRAGAANDLDRNDQTAAVVRRSGLQDDRRRSSRVGRLRMLMR
jgi:hypothetical protein